MLLLLSFATIPVVIVGLVLKMAGVMESLRSMEVIGWTMLIFGIVLYVPIKRRGNQAFWRLDLAGCADIGAGPNRALIPGTSRSGITITAARGLGYTRTEAARLSMLMLVQTIMASGVLLGKDVVEAGDWSLLKEAGIAAGLAFVALTLMMRLLKSTSFTPYVIYRIGLGVLLLWLAYS